MWSKILSAVVKYGTKVVNWVIKHKSTILNLLKDFSISFVIDWILDHI